MARVALIARLKPGCEEQAAQLVAAGPPFDPGERGFTGHEVYLSATEVVFLFEAPEVEWSLDDMLAEQGGCSPPFSMPGGRSRTDRRVSRDRATSGTRARTRSGTQGLSETDL